MSASKPLRRSKGRRRKTSMVGSPYELFMDAITNTMGVVMFILLMVVLFGRPPETVPVPDAATASRVRQLREDRDDLHARAVALPPAGDPALRERWIKAVEHMQRHRVDQDALNRSILEATVLATAQKSATTTSQEQRQQLEARLKELESRSTGANPGFVRVSRFQTDARKSVILALNAGQVSKPVVTRQTTSIAPPASGEVLGNAAQTRTVLARLLAGQPPTTHRVELIVWADSFAQAKVVEQVLLEMGYDTNPLPVMAGTPMTSGTGGVQ
jgi:hypothetical protein